MQVIKEKAHLNINILDPVDFYKTLRVGEYNKLFGKHALQELLWKPTDIFSKIPDHDIIWIADGNKRAAIFTSAWLTFEFQIPC